MVSSGAWIPGSSFQTTPPLMAPVWFTMAANARTPRPLAAAEEGSAAASTDSAEARESAAAVLAELARKYDHVRFLSLCATEARPHTDVDTLPLLVVYRGGEYLSHQEKVNSLPGVGDDLKLAGVEALLRQLGTKLTSSVALSARQQEQLERLSSQ